MTFTVGALVACGPVVENEPMPPEGGTAHASTEDVLDPVTAVNESQVFLDLSRTMSGFISDGRDGRPVTLQQDLLRNLLIEALGSVGLPEPTLFGFGGETFPLSHPLSVYATGVASTKPDDLYTERDTDVHGALVAASKNLAALSVIVTDNAQDLRAGEGGTAPGYDRSALRRTLSEDLVGKGFGVWLIGFRGSFVGDYYSILLSADDRSIRVNRPIHLSSEQPMYLWVVGQDIHQGRRLVEHLVHNLRSRHRIRGGGTGEQVHAIELSPGTPPLLVASLREQAIGEAERKAHPAIDPERDVMWIDTWTRVPGDASRVKATLKYRRSRSGELLFPLEARLETPATGRTWGTWSSDLWSTTWSFEEDGLQGALSKEVSPFRCPADGDRLCRKLSMAAARVASVPAERRRIGVRVSLAFDPAAIPRDHWLRAWSTEDDTIREGIEGRTLYLFDVVSGVLEGTIGRERPAASYELFLVKD